MAIIEEGIDNLGCLAARHIGVVTLGLESFMGYMSNVLISGMIVTFSFNLEYILIHCFLPNTCFKIVFKL